MEPVVDLTNLDGRNGFIVRGFSRRGSMFCGDVSNAGDVNNDGIEDLVIRSAVDTSPFDINFGSVIFGRRGEFDAVFDLDTLNGTNGFWFSRPTEADSIGFSVSGIGDFNGDTIDDFIVGDPFALNTQVPQAGETYVVFGQRIEFNENISLGTLDGTNGVIFPGLDVGERSGYSVGGLGDVNNDGINDIIIGAPEANNGTGRGYVVYGQQDNFNATFDLGSLDGSNGFVIDSFSSVSRLGRMVGYAGDINNDGTNDLSIDSDGGGNIIFGQSAAVQPTINVMDLNGENGFFISVPSAFSDESSQTLLPHRSAGIGDVNNDGIDDILVGIPSAFLDSPETFVLFGSNIQFPPTLSLDFERIFPSEGIVISGIDSPLTDFVGSAVAPGGDLNGDGIPDFLIGASGVDAIPPDIESAQGEAYAVFGMRNFNSSLSLVSINGDNGFVMRTERFGDQIGQVMTSLDIDSDGLSDIVIGAPFATVRRGSTRGVAEDFSEGTCFVVFSNVEPVLENNQISLKQGDVVRLRGEDLSATDINDEDSELTFIVSDVTNGIFQSVNDRGNAITSFRQQQIVDGEIEFAHNGENDQPSYSVSVRDPRNAMTTPTAANIDFSNRSSSSSNIGTIIGATVGSAAAAAGLISMAGVGFWYWRRQYKKRNAPDTQLAKRKISSAKMNNLKLGSDHKTLTEALLSNGW